MKIEWNPNRAAQLGVTPGFEFTPEEVAARAFRIEPIERQGRVIKLVSVEAGLQYTQDRTDFVPTDWAEQVADEMQDTSLVFTTYFPPELEETAYKSRFLGNRARSWGEQMLHGVYQTVADIAAEQGKPVAVCDIANRPAYIAYERSFPNRIPQILNLSAYRVGISSSEKYFPQAVDARRMFTARGIAQTIEAYSPGSTFMHVAAPAHINRIKRYLTESPSRADRMRYGLYANTIYGLDTSTRIYEHTDEGWALRSDTEYCNPGQELKPFLAGVAVGVGAAVLARRFARQKTV